MDAGLPDTHMLLLDQLLDRPAQPLHSLTQATGLSPQQVHQHLDRLTQAGCELAWHPQQGVQLLRSGLGVWVDHLNHRLADKPRLIELYRQTHSTQDTARRMARDTAGSDKADGAIAIADEQTAGRGRLGRRWIAPPGTCLTFSRVTLGREPNPGKLVERLIFATSVAIAEAIEQAAAPQPVRVDIKWPNDLLIAGRKVCGILVETTPIAGTMAAVVGVGINVDLTSKHLPEQLAHRVTSLRLCGVQVDRLTLLRHAIAAMDQAIDHGELGDLLTRWRQRSAVLAQPISLISSGKPVQGTVVDLDPYEGLIVRTAAGQLLHLPAATTSTA